VEQLTKQCLQCNEPKDDDELILCDECMEYFDMVQERVLQEQLDAIKEGIPE
jgi:predicted nucleic acid-binding Zn ribbon protein